MKDSEPAGADGYKAAAKGLALVAFAVVWLWPAPADLAPPAHRLAAVTVLMAVLWVSQALPIAVTSLIPLAAFPLLGIRSAREVSGAYIEPAVFLFLGGFVIALGIEKWGLHRRMALHVLRWLGTGTRRTVLGFMCASAFLSMWISNTASTLLMLPIALAMLGSLRELAERPPSAARPDAQSTAQIEQLFDRLGPALLLGIAYGASIGGFTTLIGTPTNVAFLGIFARQFPESPELSAGQWMLVFVPVGLVYLLAAWGVLIWRLPSWPNGASTQEAIVAERLRALGPATRAERRMLIVFATTALLWLSRTPLQFGSWTLLPGWGGMVEDWLVAAGVEETAVRGWVHDSTVAMAMAIILFLIPAERDPQGRTRYLMDWETAERLPWGILLLVGGGFALADGFSATGLSAWLGVRFAETLLGWPSWLVVAGICLLMTSLTEFTTNVATVSTLLPILSGAALRLEMDPRLILIPATISTSCAFMLPIATPPNAIVFGSGRIRMSQMARYGLMLNLAGVVLVTLATFWLLVPQLEIVPNVLPAWARLPQP